MTLSTATFVLGYLAIIFGGIFALIDISKRLRKRRPPLHFEFNRLPGESLRYEIGKQQDLLRFQLLLCFVAPPAAFSTIYAVIHLISPRIAAPIWIIICSLGMAGAFVPIYRKLLDNIRQIAQMELDSVGERVVADELRPLERDGWRVYHDIPTSSDGELSNLDHVIVGKTGVALIQTRTKCKGPTGLGRNERIVEFDGHRLDWPWGHSTNEIEELKEQRDWLEDWIQKRTGKPITVVPYLVLPGWQVESKNPRTRTKVIGHRNLCETIIADRSQKLDIDALTPLNKHLESVYRRETE